MKNLLRFTLRLSLALLGLLLAATLVLTLVRIPIDLSFARQSAEAALGDALDRDVHLQGELKVTTSLWPYFEMTDLQIGSPPGFEAQSLASLDRARVVVGLLPLVQGKVRIRSFEVEGLSFNLERLEDGTVNWAPAAPRDKGRSDAPREQSLDLVVDELLLGDISVQFYEHATDTRDAYELTAATGSARAGEPGKLDMTGSIREHPFTLHLETSSLADFLAMAHARVEIGVSIAGTELSFLGYSDALGQGGELRMEMSAAGDQLASLNGLLDVDLPPLADYSLEASFLASPRRLELTDLAINVGQSRLEGYALVDAKTQPPVAQLKLNSEQIQLLDFDTSDWSPEGPGAEPGDTEAVKRKPLDPEVLKRFNGSVEIEVAEVLSGEDFLGNGLLQGTLEDGRLSIDPLRLQTERGSILLQTSVKPGQQASDGQLRVLVEQFDFGPLVRLSQPDSEVGGILNVDVDVKMAARGFGGLLSNANGYFDVSGTPVNLDSGAVDLWAVNLLASVVKSSVEGGGSSKINCLLSRWEFKDGVMEAKNLAVDTSRIRICGKGEIDFRKQKFRLTATPKAKRPEFFSLATPIRATGSFDDLRVGMKGGALALGTTAVGFALSPVTVPLKRLLREDLPEDGSDMCQLPIGPHEEELDDLPGC